MAASGTHGEGARVQGGATATGPGGRAARSGEPAPESARRNGETAGEDGSGGRRAAGAAGPLRSMTGYGAAERRSDSAAVRLRLRSVNHRFLDLQLRLPPELEGAQAGLERQIKGAIQRGHVQLTVVVERAGGGAASLDRELAAAYLEAWRRLAAEMQLPQAAPPGLAWELLKMPGVLAGRREAGGAGEENELERLASAALAECLAEHARSREREGAALAADLRERLGAIRAGVRAIGQLRAGAEAAFAARLQSRLDTLLAGGGAGLAPERLAQEAAVLAERSDISEELVRLEAHAAEFAQILDGGGGIGKQLDFLLQEMQREANTLLAKTGGLAAEGLEITRRGLGVKAEIEKIREQAQNLE